MNYSQTTSRELRTLIKLYRSRQFVIQKNMLFNSSIVSQPTSNEYNYAIYGTIGNLSPIQYKSFMESVNSFNSVVKYKVTFELFPTFITKSIIHTSNLNIIDSILKGTIYRINITFTVTDSAMNMNMMDKSNLIGFGAFIEHLKAISFTKETNMTFMPVLILYTTQYGTQVPRRYSQFIEYNKSTMQKQSFINILCAVNSIIYTYCAQIKDLG
jgi:hypothetical protein